MSAQRNIHPSLTPRQPSGDTTRTVAGELRLATVSVEEAQKKIAISLRLQKFDAVSAHAGVPRTELSRKFGVAALGQLLFDDEEVVTAGMRLDERNHDASIVP